VGKSCIRFKKLENLESEAIAIIIASVSPDEYISYYEAAQGIKK
jgi:hypothetical protein